MTSITSRRRFAKLAAAAPLALAGARPGLAAPRTAMGVGAASYMQRSGADRRNGVDPPFTDAPRFIDYCRDLGAGGVQVGLSSLERGYVRGLRQRADEYGMYVEVSARLPRDQPDVSRFQDTVRAARNAGATVIRAAMLGGRRYEVFNDVDALHQFKQQSWKSLTMAEPILRRRRMKLAIENHKDWRIDEMLDMLKRISSEYIGVCVDTGNNMALLEPPEETVRAFAPYAFSVHLKDMAVEEYENGFLLSEVPFGEGIVDLKGIVQTLRQAQPGLRFTLEMITRDPLEIPCLTEKYWVTLAAVRAWRLSRMLNLARQAQGRPPLPRISGLSPEEQLKVEDDNVRKCLAYAAETLGI